MAYDDPIADQLTLLYERTQRPMRQQRIQQRWTRYPALAGHTLDDIATVLADPDHTDHNRVGADLLRAHRDGDSDATIVALNALRPVVFALSHPRSRSHYQPAPDDNRAHLWAAAGKLIATTNPDAVASNPRPFMFALIGHIRRDAARYGAFHANGYIPAGDTDTDINERVEANADRTDTTEQAGIASICLQQLGTYVRSSRRGHDRWQELLEHTFEGTDPIGENGRKRVRRLRPHLVRFTRAA